MNAVIELHLAEMDTIEEYGVRIPWYHGTNVQWYIIGCKHTIATFWKLAKKISKGFAMREELLKFEVIFIFM